MPKSNPKDKLITLPYKELKKLERLWLKRAKNAPAFFYDYQKKEFVKSIVEDLRKIANQTLKEYK